MEQSKINNLLNDKIGNMIIYFSNGKKTNFIKILKLLYLADEKSILESGAPISWLDYKAWMRGPVASDLYYEAERIVNDKKESYNGLNIQPHVNVVLDNQIKGHKKTMSIIPKSDFNDDDFSDFEINILESIMKDYGSKSVKELVDITHAENSLWDETVKANNLNKAFKVDASTDYPLSLFNLIKGKKFKVYCNAVDTLKYQASI
jgi:uncharacterized phage-associated protein